MTADERDVGRNLEVPCAPDCRRDISQVFRWDKDARNGRPRFLERINGTMICLTCAMLCHALRALQTGIYKKPADFKHDVVGGKGVPLLVRFIKDQDG